MFTLLYSRFSDFKKFAISCIPLMQKIGGSSIIEPVVTDKKVSFSISQRFAILCGGGHANYSIANRRAELLAQAIIIHGAIGAREYGSSFSISPHGGKQDCKLWEQAALRYEECTGVKVEVGFVNEYLTFTRLQ